MKASGAQRESDAGVDALTIAAVEDGYGVERLLVELRDDVRAGIYHPAPVRRVEIPKPDGSLRTLGIPTVSDRVCQQAAKIVLFLHAFDRAWAERGTGELVRYADDFVVLCSSKGQADEAQRRASAISGDLGLGIHPEKTTVVDLREGKEGFDFLGCHSRARMPAKLWEQRRVVRYHRWPSQRSMKRARARIKALTAHSQVGQELDVVIARLNQFLKGWASYFRSGNAAQRFRQLERYVEWRLRRLLIKKRGRNLRYRQAVRWTDTWVHDQGLHRLSGTIRYPKAV